MHKVLCKIRKRYILLTPEEEIRQKIISYLIEVKNYPISLFSVEGQIKVNNFIKRYDILVYNRDFTPFMLIECKASNIPITQETLNQISRYSLSIDAKYFLITNGIQSYCLIKDQENQVYTLEEDIPEFK